MLIGKKIVYKKSEQSENTISKSQIRVRCEMDGVIKIIGIPSHKEYIFNDENNHISVIEECDLPDFLSKTYRSGCCGNPIVVKKLFQVI